MQVLKVILVIIGLVALVGFVSLNVIWVVAYGRFLKHLRLNHYEHWKTIGSPTQFEDEPQYGSVGYVRYFWGRKYIELGDSELTNLGDKLLGKQKLMLLCILVSGVCLVVALEGTG